LVWVAAAIANGRLDVELRGLSLLSFLGASGFGGPGTLAAAASA